MTCRCNMCGTKNSKRAPRNSYWRVGIRHYEQGVICAEQKVMERRLRRTREKASLLREVW